jgi:hypothetical protein
MPDIFLWPVPSDVNVNDVRLRDTTLFCGIIYDQPGVLYDAEIAYDGCGGMRLHGRRRPTNPVVQMPPPGPPSRPRRQPPPRRQAAIEPCRRHKRRSVPEVLSMPPPSSKQRRQAFPRRQGPVQPERRHKRRITPVELLSPPPSKQRRQAYPRRQGSIQPERRHLRRITPVGILAPPPSKLRRLPFQRRPVPIEPVRRHRRRSIVAFVPQQNFSRPKFRRRPTAVVVSVRRYWKRVCRYIQMIEALVRPRSKRRQAIPLGPPVVVFVPPYFPHRIDEGCDARLRPDEGSGSSRSGLIVLDFFRGRIDETSIVHSLGRNDEGDTLRARPDAGCDSPRAREDEGGDYRGRVDEAQ